MVVPYVTYQTRVTMTNSPQTVRHVSDILSTVAVDICSTSKDIEELGDPRSEVSLVPWEVTLGQEIKTMFSTGAGLPDEIVGH